jgi:hypothetical protein
LQVFGAASADRITVEAKAKLHFDLALLTAGSGEGALPLLLGWRLIELPNVPIVKLRYDALAELEAQGITVRAAKDAHYEIGSSRNKSDRPPRSCTRATDPAMLANLLQRAPLWIAAVILLPILAGASTAPGPRAEEPSVSSAFAALVEARREKLDARARGRAGRAREPAAHVGARWIEALAVPGTPDDTARAALDVLSRAGAARDAAIALLFLRAGLEGDVEDTIRSMAARDPRTLAVLDGLVQELSVEARTVLVRAVERVATRRRDLAGALRRASARRARRSARAAGTPRAGPGQPPADGVYSVVRDVLAGSDSESLRAAIVASGRMEDADAIPHLIAILRTGAMGASTDAVWSLERITGLRLGREVQRWDTWYAREQDWWREESSTTFSALDHGKPGGARHGAARDRQAPRLAPQARRRGRAVAAGSRPGGGPARGPDPAGIELALRRRGLAQALERPEPAVVREAWRTLRSTTRKDLPSEPAAWRALFPE